jgi:hypothetical protein
MIEEVFLFSRKFKISSLVEFFLLSEKLPDEFGRLYFAP